MAASTYFAQVQQLYIAYFGRPADPVGQNYWATQIDAANGSIASLIAGFSASTESAALFGNKSTIDKVTAIYQNAFGRAPEPAGLAYWVAQLDSGKVSQAQASWTIQQSAGPGDAAAVQNKLTAAQAFTAQIDTTAEIQGYQGAAAADSARKFLAAVTQDNATATAAVTGAAAAVSAATSVGVVGTTFTLTTGVDNIVGDSGNNTIVADNTDLTKLQLSIADQINGGAGTDTLKIFLNAASTSTGQPALTSIENVYINGGNISAYTAATGTTALSIDSAIMTDAAAAAAAAAGAVTYTLAGQSLTLANSVKSNNAAAVINGTNTTTVASATDTVENVTVNNYTTVAAGTTAGVTATQTLDIAGAKVATLNLTATGAASTFTLADSGAALKTVNIAGDKAVTITEAANANVTTINASTALGNVTVDTSANAKVAAFAFTGGAGNDKLVLKAGDLALLTSGAQLDGGAGTDTLVVNDTAMAYTALNAAKGFEVLSLGTTAATVDAAQLTSIKSFSFGGVTAETISNLGAGSSVAITGNVTTATLGAAIGNTATDITLGAATTAGVTVGTLTATGLTALSLTSNGTSGNTIGTLTNSDNTTLTIKGAADLIITNALAAGTTGSKVDASALTGKLSVTGSAKADVLIGGSNDDTLISGGGADTLTGGAGKDTFKVSASVYAAAKDVTSITDFVIGTDKLVTGAAVPSALAKVAVADTNLDAALATIAAQAATAGKAAWGVFGGNTYVVVDAGGTAAVDTTDVVVKLAGTVDLGTTVAAVFA